ncbi:IS3 family transposase, partial [Mesobacillus zeae]|uniref:IS3 family transposase n=1 Tax=Mesobacillus zeae TaxID=1917180 RepID=UPI00300BEC22
IMKANQEHMVGFHDMLNREFKQEIPYKVLLTDITYLFYGKGKKAYLSTIKDASTNEILAYEISDRITLDMTYYNRYRYQWDIKKMTPVQYRDHLLKVA